MPRHIRFTASTARMNLPVSTSIKNPAQEQVGEYIRTFVDKVVMTELVENDFLSKLPQVAEQYKLTQNSWFMGRSEAPIKDLFELYIKSQTLKTKKKRERYFHVYKGLMRLDNPEMWHRMYTDMGGWNKRWPARTYRIRASKMAAWYEKNILNMEAILFHED